MNLYVYLLTACQALLSTGQVLLISVSALIGLSLAGNPALSTLPVATMFVGLMMTTIPASLIMAKIGRKRGFVLGNSIGVSGALLSLLSLYQQSFALFCFATGLLGVGVGFGNLYRFTVVEVCEKGAESRAVSLVMAGGVFAAIVGPSLAVWSQGWLSFNVYAGAFIGLAGLYAIALFLLTFIKIPPMVLSGSDAEQRPLGQILTQPLFLISVMSALVGYGVMNLLMTATPLAMEHHGHDFPSVANVIQWHVLGMFVPSFFTGRLVECFGHYRLIFTGIVLMLGCIFVNFTGQSEWQFWVALVLLGIGWNFMFIPATALLTKAYRPSEKAKTQAANEFIVFSVVTITALFSGALEATVGWVPMNLLMIPVLVLTAAVVTWQLVRLKSAAAQVQASAEV